MKPVLMSRPGYLYHSATPPWCEHAPLCVFAYEYVPSLHLAVAFSGAPAADFFGSLTTLTICVAHDRAEASLILG